MDDIYFEKKALYLTMPIDEQIILQLCKQGESNRLDYKREQYKFIGGSDHEKSELLKDVLAMANADRSETAFILIGVDEVNHHGEICGIPSVDLIDDAIIQQFINGKLNRKITFSVYRVDCAAGLVQVIEIPECLDSRPFYPKNDYEQVKKHVVKVKRGSSTVDATPDEIAEMSIRKKQTPQLEISLSSPTQMKDGRFFVFDAEFNIPENVIKSENKFASGLFYNSPHHIGDIGEKNKCEWLKEALATLRIDVRVENISDIQADDMKAQIEILPIGQEILIRSEGFPRKSTYKTLHDVMPVHNSYNLSPGENYNLAANYFMVKKSGTIVLRTKVFAKDMPPLTKDYNLNISMHNMPIKDRKIVDYFWNCKKDEFYTMMGVAGECLQTPSDIEEKNEDNK